MTYIIKDVAENSTQTQSILTAPSTVAVDERLPCSSITHTGLTVNSNGQIVLSSGYTFILIAGHYLERVSGYGDLETRWYDVTNSQFLGRSGKSWVNNAAGNSMRTSAARCLIKPSVPTILEVRIVATTGGSTNLINPSSPMFDYLGTPYFSVISF